MLNKKLFDLEFNNPILTASGTYGYGSEVESLVNIEQLGGIITKSVTRYPREGNHPPRIYETDSGMLNSIGLANVGVKEFCHSKLPYLNKLNTNIIINIAGSTLDEYIETMELLEASKGKHIGYEINISCPNVKEGGMEFGVNCSMTEKLTKKLRNRTKKILIMKLSPNVTNIVDIAKSAEFSGADMVSAINTVVGMGVNINTKKTEISTVFGGLSGPAIKPIGLANVYKLYKGIKIPIIGIGGIKNYKDVIEYILAGASLVQIGTMNYTNPEIGVLISEKLEDYCIQNKINNIHDLHGQLIV